MSNVMDRDHAKMARERDLDAKDRADREWDKTRERIERDSKVIALNVLDAVARFASERAKQLRDEVGGMSCKPGELWDVESFRAASRWISEYMTPDWLGEIVSDELKARYADDVYGELIKPAVESTAAIVD